MKKIQNNDPRRIYSLDKIITPNAQENMDNLELWEMENGMRVVIGVDEQNRGSTFEMLVNAGAIHQKKNGLAHLTEHMVFQGTKDFKDWQDFFDYSKDFNIGWNGGTADDYQRYYVRTDNDNESINAGLKMLTNLLFESKIPREKFEKEKKVVVSERVRANTDNSSLYWELFDYKFNPINYPVGDGGVLGTLEEINALKVEDSEEFYRSLFTPENMILVVTGGKTSKEYLDIITSTFSGYTKKSDWTNNPVDYAKTKQTKVDTILHKEFDSIYFSWDINLGEIPSYTIEQKMLNIAKNILSSRLMIDLRDKQGLAYTTWANASYFQKDRILSTGAEVSKADFERAKLVARDYINDFSKNPITEREFKQELRRDKSLRWLDSNKKWAGTVAWNLFNYGQIIDPTYNLYLDDIDLDMINTYIPSLISKNLNTISLTAVGNLNNVA